MGCRPAITQDVLNTLGVWTAHALISGKCLLQVRSCFA
jgi:hypothetical protein